MEVLEYPMKSYTSKKGESLNSKEFAELLVFSINKINKEITKTKDSKKHKELQDKKRRFLLYTYNEDIKQFIDVKKK